MRKRGVRKAELLPSGNFRVRVTYFDLDGKRKYRSFTASIPSEAMKRAEEFERSMKRIAPDKHNPTVRQVIEQYIRQKDGVLSPSTIRSYKLVLKTRFQGILDFPVLKLTEKRLQEEIDRESKEVSSKTVRNVYGLFSAAINNYDRTIVFSPRLPAKTRKIYPLPTGEELKALFSAVKDTNFELPVLLAVYLGLRVSEVCGLRFSDIKQNKILIHSAIVLDSENHLVEKESTKNATSTRLLNLPPFLKQKIEESQQGRSENDHIVVYSSSSFSKVMRRFCVKAGIRNIRFHDLRHVFASVMLRLNIPDKYAMQLGGWSTTSTMKTVYQHTMADYVEDVNAQITDYLDHLTGRKDSE